ncbi:MAG: 50S ribosomal protein L22 [Candidatus Micrarchaeia archaeon]
MPEYGYSYKTNGLCAKAQLYDIDASFKDLSQVCSAIKGKPTDVALKFLNDVKKMEKPVVYRKFNKKLGHRSELGGKKGRYPKKAAGIVLQVLKNAIANAEFMGIVHPYVKHACANKQSIFYRIAPKGRLMRSNYETARVEIILEEMPEDMLKKLEAKKTKKQEKKIRGE